MAPTLEQTIKLDEEQQTRVKQVDEKLAAMKAHEDTTVKQMKTLLERALEGRETTAEDMQAIDKSLAASQQYQLDMTDVAESLTREFREYGQFVGTMREYTRPEWVLSKVNQRWADKMRLARVKQADVTTNLNTIVDYGHMMIERLDTLIVNEEEASITLGNLYTQTAKDLEEKQPIYEAARSKREKIERQLADIDGKMAGANETEYAALAQDRTKINTEYKASQDEEKVLLTQVNLKKEFLPKQKQFYDLACDRLSAARQFRAGLQENLNSGTELLLTTPVSVQTVLSMKAAEKYDKAYKGAIDVSFQVALENTAGAMDVASRMLERPIITPERAEAYRARQFEMEALREQRINAIRKQYEAASSH